MSIENRREREKQEMRGLILAAAADIAAAEGFGRLSVRKIAGKIDYSPSIIYHYFKDMNEIINTLMQSGCEKIAAAIASADKEYTDPAARLQEMTKNYIHAALDMPDEFLAAQLYRSPQNLHHTASMFAGAAKEKAMLSALFQCIQEINKDRAPDESEIELTAQLIAASALGLIIKLILEKDIGTARRNRLIDHFSGAAVLRLAEIRPESDKGGV